MQKIISTNHKIKLDITFIKKYKEEDLIPTFGTVHLAIKHGTIRLRKKIACIIVDAETSIKQAYWKTKIKGENVRSNRQIEKKVDSYYL